VARTLLRPWWVAFHLLTLALVVSFIGLGWWQLSRAREGNALSIGYAFEWPVFAIFTLAVWAWLCRDAVRKEQGVPVTAPPAPVSPDRVPDHLVLPVREPATVADDSDDPQLAAWNRMLAEMNERQRR
jgi:hypothetical protein